VQWYQPPGISLPHFAYCKEGATASGRVTKRENPIKSIVPAVFETPERKLDRTFREILTRSTRKIFRERTRREDFSHSHSAATYETLISSLPKLRPSSRPISA